MIADRYLNKFLIIMTDVTVIYVSIGLAYYVRTLVGMFTDLVPLSHGLEVYFAKWWIPPVVIGSIAYHKGYGIVVSFWDDVLIMLKSLFFAFLIVWVMLSLQKEAETVSRIIITGGFVCMLVLSLAFRGVVKFFMYNCLDMREKALIFQKNISNGLESFKEFMDRQWYSGFRVADEVSFTDISDHQKCAMFLPIEQADENTIKRLKKYTRDLIVVSEMSGLSFMNTQIKTFLNRNIALITTRNGLLLRHKVLAKRASDLILATTALILMSPLFVIIPMLIKLNSKGPVYFRHTRCGRKMKEFGMNKFRTMHMNGDAILKEHLDKHPDAVSDLVHRNKIEDDPRVTRLGRILRQTSLDELPQLWNVLCGTMSIVGPRPDTIDAIQEYYSDYAEIYENVNPGLTGLWQVSGRSDVKYSERVKLDKLYMLNWSLWFDFVIILKTFRSILSREGAY